MKLRAIVLITLICCTAGTIFFLIQRNWLIIHFTFDRPQKMFNQQSSLPKALKIYYLKDEKWHHEEATIIWDENNAALNLKQVVRQWLKVLQDENLVLPHLALESAALSSPGSEAYLSFDHSLFAQEWSIMRKWQLLESLFKTLHQANFHISNLSLFVHNKPMDDDHLDLSEPLPVQERL